MKIRMILAAGAVAYLAWVKVFGVYRYLVPLEMLAPKSSTWV